jgi:hypothetical protein
MADPPMPPLLETLYLRAVISGWHADWAAYHAARDRYQDAALALLEREARSGPASTRRQPRA